MIVKDTQTHVKEIKLRRAIKKLKRLRKGKELVARVRGR